MRHEPTPGDDGFAQRQRGGLGQGPVIEQTAAHCGLALDVWIAFSELGIACAEFDQETAVTTLGEIEADAFGRTGQHVRAACTRILIKLEFQEHDVMAQLSG